MQDYNQAPAANGGGEDHHEEGDAGGEDHHEEGDGGGEDANTQTPLISALQDSHVQELLLKEMSNARAAAREKANLSDRKSTRLNSSHAQ